MENNVKKGVKRNKPSICLNPLNTETCGWKNKGPVKNGTKYYCKYCKKTYTITDKLLDKEYIKVKAIQLYLEGISNREIAFILKKDRDTITSYLDQFTDIFKDVRIKRKRNVDKVQTEHLQVYMPDYEHYSGVVFRGNGDSLIIVSHKAVNNVHGNKGRKKPKTLPKKS